MDEHCGDVYERFSEQRIQKLNKPEHFGTEDSVPTPNEPLRTVPTAPPQKGIITTSSDQGVNAPHLLSTALLVTPDNSHQPRPYRMPYTLRVNPPNGPLTPIQQFIHHSRKYKARGSKYYRSQRDHPYPQSVFRTHRRQRYKH